MKPAELNELSPDELSQKIREARGALFDARVKHSTGQLENTATMRGLRRDIARAQTILRERSEAKQ